MHGPSSQWAKDHAASLKRVLGLWMVTLYAIVYAGFIVINVAIAYGFLLILFAIFLAAVYNHVCTHAEEVMKDLRPEEETAAMEEGHS